MPIGFWAISREEVKARLHRHAFNHASIGEETIDKLKLEVEDALDEALDEAVAFFIVRERL